MSGAVPIGPQLDAVLTIAYQTRKPVLLEGPSGIGKSECVHHVANHQLNIDCIAFDLSLLEPPDLVGLPVIENGRTSYAVPATFPTEGAGILLLEELNRAERYIRQPVLQLLSARSLNDYTLPDGWSVVAAINPQTSNYDVDNLDQALRDRFLRLSVRADREAWLDWARDNGVHPAVIELARTHDRLLEDVSPRTWKHVSDLLHYCTGDVAPQDHVLSACLGGYLPEAWLTTLLATRVQFQSSDGLKVETVLKWYAKDKSLRRRVASLRSKGRTDILEQLSWQVITILDQCDLKALMTANRFSLASFERLIDDLPGDHAERAQLAFGGNKTAIGTLSLKPTHVLEGYERGGRADKVGEWMSRYRRRHRAWATATGVAHFLDEHADLKVVRNSVSARRNLGLLLHQLDYPHNRRFAKSLDRLGIKAISPRTAK